MSSTTLYVGHSVRNVRGPLVFAVCAILALAAAFWLGIQAGATQIQPRPAATTFVLPTAGPADQDDPNTAYGTFNSTPAP